jgi:hypothetical protein
MSYDYPSADELFHHMETLHPQRFSFLLKHVVASQYGLDEKELIRSEVLMLAVSDWMTGLKILANDDQQRVLLEFKHAFESYADRYATWGTAKHAPRKDTAKPVIIPGGLIRPVAQVGFLDSRFVTIQQQWNLTDRGEPRPGFFDLKTDKWIEELPHHALTLVYCDLGVLLTRLETRILSTRALQERKDVEQQHTV